MTRRRHARPFVLALDLGTGGATAAIFDRDCRRVASHEAPWKIHDDGAGSAILPIQVARRAVAAAIRHVIHDAGGQPDVVSVSAFMHSLVLIGSGDEPITPVITWLDRRGSSAVAEWKGRLGDDFHNRTGCRFHPVFPAFKLAWLRSVDPGILDFARCAVSLRSLLLHDWVGDWVEDIGMASASGLLHVRREDWDDDLLERAGVQRAQLPSLVRPDEIVGTVRDSAEARRYGLAAGVRVVAGTGDGFCAVLGSSGDAADRLCVTLGTSSATRKLTWEPVLIPESGLFCYAAGGGRYLTGAASQNGGNVLDWGSALLGGLKTTWKATSAPEVPVLLPALHGERSPFWNPELTGRWVGLSSRHGPAAMRRSAIESIAFQLAVSVRMLEDIGEHSAVVLSGNGFRTPKLEGLLAALVGDPVLLPAEPGEASLRGAARLGLSGLGLDTSRSSERWHSTATVVEPFQDRGFVDRFSVFQSEWKRLETPLRSDTFSANENRSADHGNGLRAT